MNEVANPLPACPDAMLNCVRTSRHKQMPVTEAMNLSFETLEKMGAIELVENRPQKRIDAVFRVFLFKDDFTVQFQSDPLNDEFCHIHIKSKSRVGRLDLGVNRRRVLRFLELLSNH